MNVPKLITACLVMALSMAAGCSKSDDNNYYAGYSSPGKFRPKGVAWEKSYHFSDISKSCYSKVDTTVPGTPEYPGRCCAAHVGWYSSTKISTDWRSGLPTEGIAANDRHLLPAPINFTIKMTRNVDLTWKITMALGGVKYYNNTNAVEQVKYDSSALTYAEYIDPESGETWEASTTYLKLVFVRFTSDIILYTDPEHPTDPATKSITLHQTGNLPDPSNPPAYLNAGVETYNLPTSGDYMIVQAHGI